VVKGSSRQVFRHQEQSWLAPYIVPWAAIPLALLVPSVAHNGLPSPGDRVLAAVCITLVGCGLLVMTWALVRHRPMVIRVLAPLTVVILIGWLAAVVVAGPVPGLMRILFLLAPTLAIAWNIRVATRQLEDESGSELLERVGLHRSKVMAVKDEGPWTEMHLQHAAGESTPEDVQQRRDHMAGLLRVPLADVRVRPDPDRHDRTIVSRRNYDPLAQGIPWPGLSSPGGSIAEPLVLGGYEEGPPLRLWLPGDPEISRSVVHLLVMGMNGSGKSHGAQIAIAEIASRRDCDLIVADPSKGEQTLGKLLPFISWPALTLERAMAVVDALPRMITARANQLGKWGYNQWVPEVYERYGMKFLAVWFEEATRVVRSSKTFIDIGQEARSAGISLGLSMQRPSWRNVTTDLRQQMGGSWCFGVKETNDAAFVMSDELLDAGADPGAWGNRYPGYSYLDAPGISPSLLSTPARTFSGSVDQLAAALLEHGIHAEELDEWTAAAAADPYRRRDQPAPGLPPEQTGLPRVGIGVEPFPGTRRGR